MLSASGEKKAADHMDAAVKAKILDRPRAREIEKKEYPEPTLEEVRKQYGGAHLSDEELLLRFYAGPEFVDALKTAPPRKEYSNAEKPLVRLDRRTQQKKVRSCLHQQRRFRAQNRSRPLASQIDVISRRVRTFGRGDWLVAPFHFCADLTAPSCWPADAGGASLARRRRRT